MKSTKIGITGVHGAGKSWKAIDLMEHYTFLGNKVIVVDEVARKCPYAFGTIEAQEYIWHNQMVREKDAMAQNVDVIICDRTVADNLMYYRDVLRYQIDEWLWVFPDRIPSLVRWWDLWQEAIEWMPTYDQVYSYAT